MSRRYSLRAPLAGAAQLAIVLSITGAKGAEPSTLNSEVTPATPPLARIETSDNRQPAGRLEGSTLTVRLEARNGVWYPNRRVDSAFRSPRSPRRASRCRTRGRSFA